MAHKNPSRIYNPEELEEKLTLEKDSTHERFDSRESKHTLDSDEEDEKVQAEKYNIMDANEFEGQEDATIEFDGECKITPFNLKEEMEEGYFDKDGTYIFKNEKDEIKDQWLDDIDWHKVKATEGQKRKPDDDSESDDEVPVPINLMEKYSQMLTLMHPKETVQKAICRLGGKSSRSASNRWKKKKKEEEDMETNTDDMENCRLLTRLADDIIQSGDMDIYQQTYEKMTFHVQKSVNKDAELDMFGDDFEEKVEEAPKSPASADDKGGVDPEGEVQWEFKWESSKDAKVYGPYTSSQMQAWVDEQYFEAGVLVRQVGKQDTDFYSSKRVDFELYI